MPNRRAFIKSVASAAGLCLVPLIVKAGVRRRRHRRRVRRRVRRRALWRSVHGRRLLVVPVGVAVGWEFAVDNRIVVVREVHPNDIVVVDADGKIETIAVVKEDTTENSEELEGSEYEEDDQ